ncbi:MAG: zinc ABC transporter substrate-binding protein [Microscillaceae bacterium]|nr:zinc ABC transporter substrate-binding protein [Microscillaceae bacterium]
MDTKKIGIIYVIFLLFGILTSACDSPNQKKAPKSKPLVVATTGMIADALKNIVGDAMRVQAIMGPGVDPHLYKATREDLSLLREADLIFYNGLHLEGKMGEVLEKLARQKPIFAIGNQIDTKKLHTISPQSDAIDPHIWFDVLLWSEAIQITTKALIEFDPSKKDLFTKNANQFLKKLRDLDAEVREQIQSIDKKRRVLITAHDAFGYFGRAYDIEVRGLQGISTVSEFGLKDISDLVDFIVKRKIKAVFVESSIPKKSLEAVVQGCLQNNHPVKIGGTLFSDAMGAEGTPEGTYLGMLRYNVKTITEALK